jgi:hypothetical protein
MKTILSFDLGSVWKHFKGKGFGIVSAYEGDSSKKENMNNQDNLKKEVRELGYGYKEIKGRWRTGKDEDVQFEYSLFIPNLSKEDAKALGKKYKQYAVIYTEGDSIICDKLGHDTNEVFTKIETGLKDSWISWSEYRRHKLTFSSVEWEMPVPPVATNFFSAMSLQSYLNDKGITEYKNSLQDAITRNRDKILSRVSKKLKGN